MAMNKQRRTANLNNIVTYDTLKNVTLPADLTIEGLTGAGFVKADANGLLSVDTGAYLPMPSQTGNAGKFLSTDGSVLSWQSVPQDVNIYNNDGTLTGNRELTTGGNYLQFKGTSTSVDLRAYSSLSTGSSTMTFYSNTWPYGLKIGMYGNSFGSGMNDKASIHMMSKDLYFTQSGSATPSSADITMAMFQSTKNITIGGTTDAGYKLDVQGTARITGNTIIGASTLGQLLTFTTFGNYAIGVQSAQLQLIVPGSGNRVSLGYGSSASFTSNLDASGNSVIVYPKLQANNIIQSNYFSGLDPTVGGGTGQQIAYYLDAANNYGQGISTLYTGNKYDVWYQVGAVNGGGFRWYRGTTEQFRTTINDNVLIGTSTDIASSILTLASTTKGFLPPRMTNAQRTAISTPATGLMAYSTDATEGMYLNLSGGWQRLLTSGDTIANIYNSDGTLTGNRVLTTGGNSLVFRTGAVDEFTFTPNNGSIAPIFKIYNSSFGATLDLGYGYFKTGGAQVSIGTTASAFPLIFYTSNTKNITAFTSGNILIQTGGTHTDAGYKLDVQGTGRFTGAVTLTNGTINSVADLYIATQSTGRNIIIGDTSGVTFSGNRNIAIGTSNLFSTGSNIVQIGNNTTTTGGSSIAIGALSSAAANSIAIGGVADVAQTIVIGNRGVAKPTAAGQMILGMSDIYIYSVNGDGATDQNATNVTLNSSGAFGTDRNGGTLTIAGGKGTGTGTPGDVIISTATATTSGTTLQSLTNRVWIKGDTGNVGIGTSSPARPLDVNGTVRIADGSSIEFGGVTTAIAGTSSSNALLFYTSSTERMRITSGGNLLVGTTTDSGERLKVAGAAKLITGVADSLIFKFSEAFGNTALYTSWDSGLDAGNVLAFKISNAAGTAVERMRILGDGKVGIGTDAPSAKLHIGESGAAAQLWLQRTDGYNPVKLIGGTLSDGNGFKITMNTTDVLNLTSSGNLGLGVTPSAWGSSYTAFQSKTASMMGDGSAAYFSSNWYFDTGNKYIGNGFATSYQQYSGQHVWFTAANNTGGAGAAISFTQAMTLDASGRLGIGTTSTYSASKLVVSGSTATGGIVSEDTSSGGSFIRILGDATSGNLINFKSSTALRFATSDSAFGTFAELARITSGGNLLVGTTTDAGWKLQVNGTIGSGDITAMSGNRTLTIDNITNYGQSLVINAAGSLPMYLQNNGSTAVTISGGNVGIGTTSPSQKLDVIGYSRATAGFVGNSGLSLFADNSSTSVGLYLTTANNVGIGTTSPTAKLEVRGSSAQLLISQDATHQMYFGVDSSYSEIQAIRSGIAFDKPLVLQRQGGNVGIGTTSPDGTLVLAAGTNGAASTGGYLGFTTGVNNSKVRGAAIETFTTGTGNDHGLRFYTNDAATAPAERMRITSGGNLLVGTTTDNGYKLQVDNSVRVGNGSGGLILGADGGSAIVWTDIASPLRLGANGTEYIRVTSAGNVGIGTTSPTRPLHVIGGDGGTGTHIAQFEGRSGVVGMYIRGDGNVGIGTTSPETPLQIDRTNSGSSTGLFIRNTASSTLSNSSDIWFGSWAGASTTNIYNARISALNVNAGNAATDLLFYTYSGSGSSAGVLERMRITGGGEVILNNSASSADVTILRMNGGSSGYSVLRFSTGGTLQSQIYSYANTLFFDTNGSERGRITSGGNLLVGTTTDNGQKFQVSGNSQITHSYAHTTGSFTSGLTSFVTATTAASPSYTSGMFYGALNTFYSNEFSGNATVSNSVVMSSQLNVARVRFVNANSTITMSQGGSGIRAIANQVLQFQFDNAQTSCVVSHVAGSQILAPYYVGANNPTITNYYGLAINPSDEYGGTLAVTNRWGIYQAGGNDKNYFNGNVLIGSNVDGGQKLQVTGSFSVTTSSRLSTSSGNVNIGSIAETEPFLSNKLNVGGSVYFNGKLYIEGSGTAGEPHLKIASGNTNGAQIRLLTSTAPTTPTNGDIWFDGTDVKIRVGGVTKTFTIV